MEAGNFRQWLKNDLQQEDTWDIFFKANGLDCILIMTEKETGITKEVEGNIYNKVLFIKAESKMIVNNNLINLNSFTQYYYADGIGLILTASSAAHVNSLFEYRLN